MPLPKAYISNIQADTDLWHQARLAKLTSSEWHHLMGEKPFTTGALQYIRRKVGEELSGVPARNELETEATKHGKLYEPEAINEFGVHMGLKFLVTQKMISNPEKRFGSTPDAIWVLNESIDKLSYTVRTAEIKCPPSYDAFIELALCKTPADVYKAEKKYYWQVCHQMVMCDASVGYLVIYHPLMRVGKLRIIEFKKSELREHFKLINERAEGAVIKFNEMRLEMMNIVNPTNSIIAA